jgi:tetratricopeptide (TPR) repeat protein
MWRWSEGEADLRAAIKANATLVDARQWLGELLLLTGRRAEAVQALADARQLDPTSPVLVAIHGLALGANGQYDAASSAIEASVRLDTTFVEAYAFGGAVQLYAGRAEPGIAWLARGLALAPGEPLLLSLQGYGKAISGDTTGAHAILAQLERAPDNGSLESERAHVLLGLRDTSAALTALEHAVANREPLFSAEPLATPLYASIRNSPRFAAILVQLGFDAAAIRAIRSAH